MNLTDNTLESGLEPLDRVVTGDLVATANGGLCPSSSRNAGTRAVPVDHTISTNSRFP